MCHIRGLGTSYLNVVSLVPVHESTLQSSCTTTFCLSLSERSRGSKCLRRKDTAVTEIKPRDTVALCLSHLYQSLSIITYSGNGCNRCWVAKQIIESSIMSMAEVMNGKLDVGDLLKWQPYVHEVVKGRIEAVSVYG